MAINAGFKVASTGELFQAEELVFLEAIDGFRLFGLTHFNAAKE